MKPRFALQTLVCAGLLVGCASTSTVMLGHALPAIAPEQVQVYTTPPPRYHEVALLETQSGSFTYGEGNKMNSVLGKLRAAAAKLGANGVLLQESGNEPRSGGVGVGVGGGHWGGHSSYGGGVGVDISPARKHARAIAISVDTPAPTTP